MSLRMTIFQLMWVGNEVHRLPFRDFTAFQNVDGSEGEDAMTSQNLKLVVFFE